MDEQAIHWCNAQKLCTLKVDGGLGFKIFHDFYLALLAKQGWRLTLDALWAHVVKSIYFPRKDFMADNKGSRPS